MKIIGFPWFFAFFTYCPRWQKMLQKSSQKAARKPSRLAKTPPRSTHDTPRWPHWDRIGHHFRLLAASLVFLKAFWVHLGLPYGLQAQVWLDFGLNLASPSLQSARLARRNARSVPPPHRRWRRVLDSKFRPLPSSRFNMPSLASKLRIPGPELL